MCAVCCVFLDEKIPALCAKMRHFMRQSCWQYMPMMPALCTIDARFRAEKHCFCSRNPMLFRPANAFWQFFSCSLPAFAYVFQLTYWHVFAPNPYMRTFAGQRHVSRNCQTWTSFSRNSDIAHYVCKRAIFLSVYNRNIAKVLQIVTNGQINYLNYCLLI